MFIGVYSWGEPERAPLLQVGCVSCCGNSDISERLTITMIAVAFRSWSIQILTLKDSLSHYSSKIHVYIITPPPPISKGPLIYRVTFYPSLPSSCMNIQEGLVDLMM